MLQSRIFAECILRLDMQIQETNFLQHAVCDWFASQHWAGEIALISRSPCSVLDHSPDCQMEHPPPWSIRPTSCSTCMGTDLSFLPEASFGHRVLSSPASVGLCVCVCMCVYQSRACPLDNSSPSQARITKFRPEMQNTLVWVPIVFGDDRPWSSRSNLIWKSNFTSFWACSHHYSSVIQARISKFGPKMHLSTVKIPTYFGLDWFWSSLSFSILKPIFSTKFICALFVYI